MNRHKAAQTRTLNKALWKICYNSVCHRIHFMSTSWLSSSWFSRDWGHFSNHWLCACISSIRGLTVPSERRKLTHVFLSTALKETPINIILYLGPGWLHCFKHGSCIFKRACGCKFHSNWLCYRSQLLPLLYVLFYPLVVLMIEGECLQGWQFLLQTRNLTVLYGTAIANCIYNFLAPP